jgi:hypothetical protein
MNTEDMPWLSEEFVPVADPDDLKTLWNLGKDSENLL